MPRQETNHRIRILILSSALLAGCVTKQEKLVQGLQALHGRNLEAAVQRLGPPVGEENIAGMRVLVWSANETRTEHLTQTTSASVGPSGSDILKAYGAEFAVNTPVIVHAHCTIRLHIGKDDIILGSSYDGDLPSCYRYIQALNPSDRWLHLRQWEY